MNPRSMVLMLWVAGCASTPGAPGARTEGRFAVDDPEIDWRWSPEQLERSCQVEVERARARLRELGGLPPERTPFAAGLGAVETTLAELDDALIAQRLLAHVGEDEAVRDASMRCNEMLAALRVEAAADASLLALARSAERHASTRSERQLARIHVERGRQAGAHLEPAARQEVRQWLEELRRLELAFQQALRAERRRIVLSSAEAATLPPVLTASLRAEAEGASLPVGLSSYEPFMRHVTSAEARRRYLEAFFNLGGDENLRRVEQAVALRRRIAERLGFESWAAYRLDTQMAGTPARALALVNEVGAKLLPRARAEFAELVALKARTGDASPFAAWDHLHYLERLEQSRFSIGDEDTRPYFPVDAVVSAVLALYEELLGVRFHALEPARVWAAGVEAYLIRDGDSGEPLGRFFLDLAPRPGKFLRPASVPLRPGRRMADGRYRLPISSIIGNGPAALPGQRALFSHRDVVEFFHEFGHLLHATLARSDYAALHGYNVRGDFIEAPSQMLENWMWQPGVLQRVSRHVETGAPLPEELIAQLLARRHAGSGMFWTRQAFLAAYDLHLHGGGDGAEPVRLWFELLSEMTPLPPMPGMPPASFMPIMGGYDVRYYGYLWSRVYAQDMFTVFEQGGVDDPGLGRRYRSRVLEPGGGVEPEELLMDFLGRPANPEAFFRELGLEQEGREGAGLER